MIVNLTPHPIRLYADDRPDGIDDLVPGLLHVIEPGERPARLGVVPLSREYRDGVPVEVVQYGHAQGLPRRHAGVSYVVSLPVALALAPRRSDLLVPYREVRDSAGTVIGCRQLAQPV
ncbi:hypothetical protein [Streptomyces sp.]|uniref:hypothetical protein n=1 Tax=Streptomyces sp. TaxID=1931 RepID=UPI002D55905D|nr:hypothetical protein [Streptomyces sp.]HZF92087.1 hypothetical protein [Streptomyces sp.]